MDIIGYSRKSFCQQVAAQQLLSRAVRSALRSARLVLSNDNWIDAGDGGYLVLEGDLAAAADLYPILVRRIRAENRCARPRDRIELRFAISEGVLRVWRERAGGIHVAGPAINNTARLLTADATSAGAVAAVISHEYRSELIEYSGFDASRFWKLPTLVDKHGFRHRRWTFA